MKRMAVIGAGMMGLGIGVEFARFGYDVRLFNTSSSSSHKAIEQAREDIDLMVGTELLSQAQGLAAYERLHPTTDIAEAASGADYIVEAVLESLPLKKEVFAKLDEICPPAVILATNTSGLRVTEIASVTKYPERVVATHYFHPPLFVPLVEVAAGQKTDRKVVDFVMDLLHSFRKKAVLIDVEIPGFVGNRLQGVMGAEIQSLVDKGVCTPEHIDEVIEYGFGRRLAYGGHFKRLDVIGLDFHYMTAKGRGREPWAPIAQRVERGELGMKSGKGFYDWPPKAVKEFNRRLNTELIRLLKEDMKEGRI